MRKIYACCWARKSAFPDGITGQQWVAPDFVEANSAEDAYKKFKAKIIKQIEEKGSTMRIEDYLFLVTEYLVFDHDEFETEEIKPAIRHLELD